MTMRTKLTGLGLAAAATVGMALVTAEPASAQHGFHGGRGGFHGGGGGFRGGFAGGGFRGARGFGGGFAGRGYGGGYGGRGYRYGGYGLATGLAFGALAASAYPYGYGGYYGAGYGGGYYATGYGGGDCYVEPRRVYGPYGVRIRQVQVCY